MPRSKKKVFVKIQNCQFPVLYITTSRTLSTCQEIMRKKNRNLMFKLESTILEKSNWYLNSTAKQIHISCQVLLQKLHPQFNGCVLPRQCHYQLGQLPKREICQNPECLQFEVKVVIKRRIKSQISIRNISLTFQTKSDSQPLTWGVETFSMFQPYTAWEWISLSHPAEAKQNIII